MATVNVRVLWAFAQVPWPHFVFLSLVRKGADSYRNLPVFLVPSIGNGSPLSKQ